MKRFFQHFFLPHHSNNQRARLLHHDAMLFLVVLLLATSFLVSAVKKNFSSVLGASVDVSTQDLLILTNQARQNAGLSPLNLNDQLSQAAAGKAQDMFTKNYWAHFAPDGTSPWDFIKGAGYSYTFAGENLARGFTTSQDTVNAWMASPDHRANILSSNYQDVGFAVARGRLGSDSDTVLVVQMFGSKALAQVPQNTKKEVVAPTIAPVQVTPVPSLAPVLGKAFVPTTAFASLKATPIIDSTSLTRGISILLLSLFLMVFALDLILTEKRSVVRLTGHSFDHMLFLGVILIIAVILNVGVIS
ncbi:MAG: CAP domain-containing protein [Candidatus Levyibacteriota bacterium]